MDLESYERVMVRGAVKDTQWENLAFFLDGLYGKSNQRFLFSPEMNAKNLLQFEKKCPEAFLMGKILIIFQYFLVIRPFFLSCCFRK